ncbi:D-ribose pyranase [Faecalicatena acetigenes]|uniref:D-ribose pyranase n=1 Tax=Faecalicatena acetigenes TaxID=2981790 RepID=A0ABT2T7P9_9FIRM|nr:MULTISPECIES: D-ribose pyranase [Lachnospiraceae]MCU6746266.1 D-ribose pyranase [Faecalicatena acetigenes]SCH04414.1 D-ribose pyranase [uncultured Clostridium sp.]
MVTNGIQNIHIASMLNFAQHMDEIIICDIGFPIPKGVDYVDLVLKDDVPTVNEVLDEVLACFSVEKVIMAEEGRYYNPSYVDKIQKKFDPCIPFQFITHKEFKMRSQKVKGIIRTGDYTANSNVLLVSADSGKFHREYHG